jgi:hypothetical protein
VTSWAFQGQRLSGEGTTPLGIGLLNCLWWNVLLFPGANTLSRLCSLLGSQHYLVGSSSPWRSELIISLCVPVQYGTCPLGMILHINRYALHGLISHMDHSNVNQIQSSILLNMCIKPFLPSQVLKDIIQICKASLEGVTGHPIGLVSTGKGLFSKEIKSKSCKWVRWIRDVLTRVQWKQGNARLTCGCVCRRQAEPVLDASVSKPNSCLLFLFLYCFFSQEAYQGTLPWRGDQWWQCYPQVLSRK